MDEIKVINLEEILKNFTSKKLDDKEFTKLELIKAQVEKPVEIDEVSFSFGASGNFTVQLFNSPDDQDDDNIIGNTSDHTIQATPQEAWLKYGIKSSLKASAGLELSNFGFDIEGEKNLIFNSYRVHKNQDELLRTAIANDFTPFLFIASLEHIKSLHPGEALAVYLPGKLSLSISLSWSDIFSGSLSAIEKLLQADGVFSLEIGAKVTVALAVTVQDDFSAIIRKNSNGTYELFVKKAQSRQIAGKLSASIGIAFKEADAVKKILGKVTEGLIDQLKGEIQPILDKVGSAVLSSAEKAIVKEAGAALGFDADAVQTVSDFENKLNEKLGKVIEEIATTKVQLGFGYEYNRISTNSVLLQAELTEAAMEEYHPGVSRFKLEEFNNIRGRRFKGLLTDYRSKAELGKSSEEIAAETGIRIKNFLLEKKLEHKQAWGFSLGLGKWTLEGKDRTELTEVVRENLQKQRQVAFNGVRSYGGNLFGSEHSWKVDFNAEMDRFSQNPMPLVNELKYGLYMVLEWKKEKRISQEVLWDIVDQAVLWKVIGQGQSEKVYQSLVDLLTSNSVKNIQAAVHLKFDSDTFINLIGNVAFLIQHKPQMNAQLMARALGASMTHMQDFLARRTVAARAEIYGPLWEKCLLRANGTESNEKIEQEEIINLAYLAQAQLKKFGENLLAAEETKPANTNSSSGKYFSSTLYMNSDTRIDWNSFKNGLMRLYNGYSHGLIYKDVVKKSFQSMQQFWQQEHYVRALGYYLLYFAENNHLVEGVGRTLTINYEMDGEQKVISILGKTT